MPVKPPLFLASLIFLLSVPFLFAGEAPLETEFSGYAKSLNFFTRTSGFTPEQVDDALARREENENVFQSLERIRLRMQADYKLSPGERLIAKIDYDHQAHFGSFVSTGDFRISKKQAEDRQFLDLSQTFVEKDSAFYEHRLYRASLAYESEKATLEVGRQQIPWGIGHFFTPTDLLNPFNPTQLELDEREGVDAVNLSLKKIAGLNPQFVYTPPGRQLHPQRYLARVSRDLYGYEVGLFGGRVKRDHAVGFDIAGNLRDSAVRGEFLYREAELEKDFIKFTVNADYNFPHNVHALLEYYFNGQGRREPLDYQRDRQVRGDIQQLAKNYLALLLGYDLTPLLRIENRTIFNLDDVSLFIRPELQYEIISNLLLTAGAQLFGGDKEDELGQPKNIYFGEIKYSF